MPTEKDHELISSWARGKYMARPHRRAHASMSSDCSTLSVWGTVIGHLVAVGGKKRGLAILNGDGWVGANAGWGNGNYAAVMRNALLSAQVPFVVIPFEACRAAGIDVRTIRLVHKEDERFESIHHRSLEPPASMRIVTSKPVDQWFARLGEQWIERDDPMRADVVGVIRQSGDLRWRDQAVIKRNGKYEWFTDRHWLGDAVFLATVQRRNGRRRRNVPFVSSFDRQESTNLYFLSELPRHAVDLSDALEALKPESVVCAESMGRVPTRQGDMFGIPMPGITRRHLRNMGAVFTRRVVTIDWREHARAQMAQRKELEAIAVEVGPRPQYDGRYRSEGYLKHREESEAWAAKVASTYNERAEGRRMTGWQVPGMLRYQPSRRWDRERDVTGEPLLGNSAHRFRSGDFAGRYPVRDRLPVSRARDHQRASRCRSRAAKARRRPHVARRREKHCATTGKEVNNPCWIWITRWC